MKALAFFELLFFFVFAFASSGLASTGSSESYWLRRMSFHLKARNATPAEVAALAKAPDKKAFLAAKAAEYVQTEAFVKEMRFQIFENLRFENATEERSSRTSAQLLTEKIMRENLSWYELWTARSYELRTKIIGKSGFDVYSQTLGYQRMTETQFFGEVASDAKLIEDPLTDKISEGGSLLLELKKWSIEFKKDDPRIAGIVTTPRFASRFANSGLNKSRRRSSVLFRVLLCDAMSLSIEAGAGGRNEEIDGVFPAEDTGATPEKLAQELAMSSDKQHGADQRCAACHDKLDPMGKVLNSLGTALSSMPFRGALVYRAPERNIMVHEKVQGIGQLMEKIVQQPEYRSCQTKWFWQQFMGEDVPLTKERHQEIDAKFDQVGRRPKDFVKYLVMQPEFYQAPKSVPELDFSKIKPLLQSCDRCHSESKEFLPEFAVGPISLYGNPAEHSEWIKKMKDRVLLNGNEPERMPRNWRDWSPRDLELLRNWLKNGANYGT